MEIPSLKALVLDDDEQITELIGELALQAGYEVMATNDHESFEKALA